MRQSLSEALKHFEEIKPKSYGLNSELKDLIKAAYILGHADSDQEYMGNIEKMKKQEL